MTATNGMKTANVTAVTATITEIADAAEINNGTRPRNKTEKQIENKPPRTAPTSKIDNNAAEAAVTAATEAAVAAAAEADPWTTTAEEHAMTAFKQGPRDQVAEGENLTMTIKENATKWLLRTRIPHHDDSNSTQVAEGEEFSPRRKEKTKWLKEKTSP